MTAQASSAEESGKPGQKPWFLYLIECQDGSLYAGITPDVAARYAAHERGKGARYTRSHPPAKLLGTLRFPDRSCAAQAEHRIKQLKPAEKRLFIAGRLQPQVEKSDQPDSAAN